MTFLLEQLEWTKIVGKGEKWRRTNKKYNVFKEQEDGQYDRNLDEKAARALGSQSRALEIMFSATAGHHQMCLMYF